MAKKEKIILVGGGGHASVVVDAIKRLGTFEIAGIIDPRLNKGSRVLDIEIIGADDAIPSLFRQGIKNAFIGVGSVGDCAVRKKLYSVLKKIGFRLPAIVHPDAVISENVKIGEGAFIGGGAVVNPGTRIGNNAIINTRSSVDHDCIIGDFVHIAPGAVLSGGVNVGNETHIGTGAHIIHEVLIGQRCIIAAGATVWQDLQDNARFLPVASQFFGRRNKKTFIIAEAGVNHNGSLAIAKKMVDVAAKAGVDAIKFQTFSARRIATASAPKAAYQKEGRDYSESHREMLKNLELSGLVHRKLLKYCRERGVVFLSSPFDVESIDLLVSLELNLFKIPSGEITNVPYLRKIGSLGKRLILSTGMSNMEEVKAAIDMLMNAGTARKDITVLQCNSEYPTPFKDANLLAMLTMRDAFKIRVGYSDHTLGIEIPIAAVALGASIIEKHFTLSRDMKGPDHRSSIEPGELADMVHAIRNVESALGSGIKIPSLSELKNKSAARKVIVASKSIKKGQVFSENNITAKRSCAGLAAMNWDYVVGKAAKKNFNRDEAIDL